jgi:hypothetical protein
MSQIQLARRCVAGVAAHAAFVEQGLYTFEIELILIHRSGFRQFLDHCGFCGCTGRYEKQEQKKPKSHQAVTSVARSRLRAYSKTPDMLRCLRRLASPGFSDRLFVPRYHN